MATQRIGVRFNRSRREALEGYLYISPWIVGFLAFALGPMIASLYFSFTQYNVLSTPKFAGLYNYVYMFTRDRLFIVALERTAYYAVVSVVLGVGGSLLLAVLLDQRLFGVSVFRTLYFLPSLTPIVASALLWGWIFQPQFGMLNYLLSFVGLKGPAWLQSTEWAMPALIIMALWGGLGGGRMIIFIAGLQGIPQELYEAASMDGAGTLSRFLNVTLPLLTPTIFFNLVLGIIGSFSVFSVAYVATGGGPADATYFYVFHIFNRAFKDLDMGYAAALAWIFFLVLLVFTLIQFAMQKYWVYYEE
ncbi:MAG: carbohydrate ABC transporter permease, partial [Dehalococcoidia bacterium]